MFPGYKHIRYKTHNQIQMYDTIKKTKRYVLHKQYMSISKRS